MRGHERAKPGVLQLLLPPEVGERLAVRPDPLGQLGRRGVHVEKGAVGVEDAGLLVRPVLIGHGDDGPPAEIVSRSPG